MGRRTARGDQSLGRLYKGEGMNENKRLEGIQALRAIAFIEIFLRHCGVEAAAASFGVTVFIVMSGFCMAVNYLPRADKMSLSPVSSVKFGVSKIKKLYPLHLIMLAAIWVIVKMPKTAHAIQRLLMDVFLVKCWAPHSDDYFAYNSASWYFATYLFICIMAPYVIKLVSKIKTKAQLFTSGTIVYAVMLGVGYYVSVVQIPIGDAFAKWLVYICPLYRILDFSLGVMLGWLFLNRKNQPAQTQKKNHLLEIFALIVCVLLECGYPAIKESYMGIAYNSYFILGTLLLVWLFAVKSGFITGFLSSKPLIWLGNISGYLFLINQVVTRTVRMYSERAAWGPWYLLYVTVVSFVISVAIAYVYIWGEKQAAKCLKK